MAATASKPQSLALPSATAAAIAAHRFGLGEASLDVVGADARGWLLAQIGPADAARGRGLLDTRAALQLVAAEREKRQAARNPPPGTTAEQLLAGHYRDTSIADARSRLATAAASTRPFAERLQLFWANHFTVSLAKGSVRGLVGAFERDAIRPHIAGPFETLLYAATTHPAMLRYLDNAQSAGPRSRFAERAARFAARQGGEPRTVGLNENLAREVLELHTLGAESARAPGGAGGAGGAGGGYTQADVTAFAALLTGWRVALQEPDAGQRFDAAWHEPGPKLLLGKRYPEGPEALRLALHDLALHPATARFLATKLARHFVADDPPPALVDALASSYLGHAGELAPVYRTLIAHPLAWQPEAAKLKTPEEFVVSSLRVLQRDDPGALAAGVGGLGQRIHVAPSPAGWSDRAADWLGPDAVWKRVEWATRVAERLGAGVDARELAARSFGPLLGEATRTQIERAADGRQALALLLLAPEFQRR